MTDAHDELINFDLRRLDSWEIRLNRFIQRNRKIWIDECSDSSVIFPAEQPAPQLAHELVEPKEVVITVSVIPPPCPGFINLSFSITKDGIEPRYEQ